jgi:hypothetical protein
MHDAFPKIHSLLFFSSSNVKQLQIHGWLLRQSLFFLAYFGFLMLKISKKWGVKSMNTVLPSAVCNKK